MGKGKKPKDQKPKKEKIIYVDDGSTIADMSGVGRSKRSSAGGAGKSRPRQETKHQRSTFREQWRTYVDAVKLMFFPMLVVLAIIAVAFLIVYLIL